MYLVLMRTYLFFNRTFIYNWYDILNLFSRLGVTIGCRQFITQSLHRLLQSTCTWSAIMMNTPTGLMCQLQNQSNFFLTYTWCGRPVYKVKFLSSRGREWGRENCYFHQHYNMWTISFVFWSKSDWVSTF